MQTATHTRDTRRPSGSEPEPLPFVAPCRQLEVRAPLRWVRQGWEDMKQAPRQSLSYGLVMVLLTYVVSYAAWKMGSLFLLLGLLSGFIFLGPALAIGLYSISCQLQRGERPRLGYCLREGRRHLGNELVFAVMLLVVALIWARAASMVHVFFPVESHPAMRDLLIFLGIGTAVGSVFAAIVFSISAFSLPMIMDRKVDPVTAVVTSVNAVLRNRPAMVVWAAIIVATVAVGFVTGFLALVVLLPLIGHATWHAYRDTIDASAWPAHVPEEPGG
jgi:uncharacterized membrane protein